MRKSEKIFYDPATFFEDLLKGLARAQATIEMEYYIFAIDRLGSRILTALESAAARGVRVRLLVDGAGSIAWSVEKIRQLKEKKIRARIFHPFSHLLRKSLWFLVRFNLTTFAEFFMMLNRRNHRKLCIVDGQEYWCGSMNVSDLHQTWRETGMHIVSHSESRYLQKSFDWNWSAAPAFKLRRPPPHIETPPENVRLNQTLRQRRSLYAEFLQSILFSKARIWITNPYFIPDYSFIRALKWIAPRGCDVRLLVPAKSDVAFFPHVSAVFYEQLLRAGVRIYEYKGRLLHAKIRILDDQVWVGSSNLNSRSLLHDLELEVRIEDVNNKEEIALKFEEDLRFSEELTLDALARRSFLSKIFGYCSLVLRYWL